MIELERLKKAIDDNTALLTKFKKDWERYKTKQVTIFNRVLANPQKINNKINHDYVGVIINTKVGHFLGNPVSISFDNSDDKKSNELLRFKRYTAFDRVITELGIQAAVFGYGVCLAYIDEKGKFDFIEIDPWTVIFGTDFGARIITVDSETQVLEVYDNEYRYYYSYKDGNIAPLNEFNGIKSGTKHMFDKIPLFKFKNNKEEVSETYRVRNIIDVVDRMYSDLASELEQFRLAYIKFIGCEPTPEEIENMIQTGALCIKEPGGDVGFITKQLDIQGVLNAIEREVQNIYKFAQTYDANQSKEGYGQLTNLGIHFLMAPLNNNCKKTIHYFKEALYQLFDLYSQTVDGRWLDPLEISFNFTLDTPRNILEESQIQRNLVDIVSTETRLKLATFVDDAQKEMKRMEDEKQGDSLGGNYEDFKQ